MLENIHTIRNGLVNFHVLRDGHALYVIDGGFIGGRQALARGLQERGWSGLRIEGIIVTHGHLDHILNVAALASEHGAWIAAPALDAPHYAGKPVYRGWSAVTGVLETAGRRLLRFQPFAPDHPLFDGDMLPIWDGLQAVHLPGHTAGHIGLLCRRSGLLFSADLFASYGLFSHAPPAIFNQNTAQSHASLRRALDLNLKGVLPNHGDLASPTTHLDRLRSLAGRHGV